MSILQFFACFKPPTSPALGCRMGPRQVFLESLQRKMWISARLWWFLRAKLGHKILWLHYQKSLGVEWQSLEDWWNTLALTSQCDCLSIPVVQLSPPRYSWYSYIMMYPLLCNTSNTAQGGGGSFKNRKPIGEVGCCESRMAERSHWWTERCLRSPLFLSLSVSFSDYLPTYLPIYLCIYLSFYLPIYLPIYLSIYPSIHPSIYLIYLIYLSISSISSIYLSNLSSRLCIHLYI